MSFITGPLESYILNNISKEDEVLQELNRQTHLKVLHPRMLSGHQQGLFLESISRMMQPKRILEVGTYTGYSAICLAKGLQEDGKLITIEINDELENFATEYIKKSGFQDKIEQKIGDARTIVPELDNIFDIVFLDAEKSEYTEYLELVKPVMRKGGLLLADNVLWSGKVVEKLDDNDVSTKGILNFNQTLSRDKDFIVNILPIRDGITMAVKL